MNGFTFSSTQEFKTFLNNEKNKKILIICGKKSYKISGASKLIDDVIEKQNVQYFYKKFPYPDLVELKEIINKIKECSPDIIIAVGGGSVLDYAKIANVLTNSLNIEREIADSSYKIKKNFLN